MAAAPLLSVRDLRVDFKLEERFVRAVHEVSFDLRPGEVLGVVGESGCGKSVTSLSVLRLIPSPRMRTAGSMTPERRRCLRSSWMSPA